MVKSFSDMRPISLSSFVKKIISRTLHERLQRVLPKIISQNNSEFSKDRNIVKNILLAHKIIRDINKRNTNVNVVMKLDMEKVYDRVSWIFLTKVLMKFGFSECLVDLVWRLLNNNWYSVLVNEKFYDFFQSTRGLKQGGPLSPTLLIIMAKVLSKSLNKLNEDNQYKGFGLPNGAQR